MRTTFKLPSAAGLMAALVAGADKSITEVEIDAGNAKGRNVGQN